MGWELECDTRCQPLGPGTWKVAEEWGGPEVRHGSEVRIPPPSLHRWAHNPSGVSGLVPGPGVSKTSLAPAYMGTRGQQVGFRNTYNEILPPSSGRNCKVWGLQRGGRRRHFWVREFLFQTFCGGLEFQLTTLQYNYFPNVLRFEIHTSEL